MSCRVRSGFSGFDDLGDDIASLVVAVIFGHVRRRIGGRIFDFAEET